jgi:hypothetical protein
MMPKLEYFIVCESVSVDQQTNRVSLFNVIEEVWSSRFPATISQAIATSAWHREPADEHVDYQVQLRIYAPGEDSYKEFPVNVKIEKDRHRIFHELANLRVSQPGNLKFEVLINGQYAATHTVTIFQEGV